MTRREARDEMMKLLYQLDLTYVKVTEIDNSCLKELKLGNQGDYCKKILSIYRGNKESIDELIEKYSVGWKISRMPKTDIAVLRLATCELKYMDDIPFSVTINEAVELTKKYGTNQSHKFVNAILGSIVDELSK